jgi:hypothetical protein
MRQLRHGELNWTAGDDATYARWRRAVLIFYGCLGLAAVSVFAIYRVAEDGFGPAAPAVASVSTQTSNATAPPSRR